MSFKEYASKEYVHDNFLKQQWETTDSGKVVMVNSEGKVAPQILTFDHIIMMDRATGYKYFLYLENNKIVTSAECVKIEVTAMPTRTSYIEGEPFDPAGMVAIITYVDGSTNEITDFAYDPFVLTNEVAISYTDINGAIIATTINVEVTAFDPEIMLIDFEYTTNSDGTYTITDWKDTLNGEPSTEMIVPDNHLIIV